MKEELNSSNRDYINLTIQVVKNDEVTRNHDYVFFFWGGRRFGEKELLWN